MCLDHYCWPQSHEDAVSKVSWDVNLISYPPGWMLSLWGRLAEASRLHDVQSWAVVGDGGSRQSRAKQLVLKRSLTRGCAHWR